MKRLEHSDVNNGIDRMSAVKKKKMPSPKFRLKGKTGESALLSTPAIDRVPLMLTDIQHLLLHSLLGNLNVTQAPRWYVIDKISHISHTVCLVFEGVSIKHWEEFESSALSIKNIFDDYVEILTPSRYGGSLVDELALVPLTEADKDDLIQTYGSMNLALDARKDLNVMMKAVFPIENAPEETVLLGMEDKFPRTQLVMSAWQLIEENYPLPLKGKLQLAFSDYVMTKDSYEAVTDSSPMFGLDCEMCITHAGSELTWVSIVDEKHETIYSSLVKPYNNITDYLTRYSGLTQEMLENVTKRLEDVQTDIRNILPPDAILIGQSLNTDLHALKMMHPYVIDTSIIYNFTGERTRKPKLKALAKEFLQQDIQQGKKGHCPTEDSLAALKLVQLKLSKNIEYGDAVHTNRQKYKENLINVTKTEEYALSIFHHILEQKKTSLLIGCDDITGDYHSYLTQAKESVSLQLRKNKAKKIKLSTLDTQDDVIQNLAEQFHNYNLAMAHLRLTVDGDGKLISRINTWIDTVWSKLSHGSLLTVVFGGTSDSNGLAMVKVKINNKC